MEWSGVLGGQVQMAKKSDRSGWLAT